ncbi:uncharacterized protein SPSK_08148 [Sporothrix schenckii 1099-18]|uniref:Uncharacterized protein n=1 Tax=Sporothrix schenckii 1099-18 TaxID=1397361 RepID=A0A0F2ME45_SPOSC|nr:uncharacterized protein SPSK_08148 [Sporothrix schenckii 1099-18]KJR87917.1 hypothetical protein SPSK_08148 [Sporothrix schenckii 1099-18]
MASFLGRKRRDLCGLTPGAAKSTSLPMGRGEHENSKMMTGLEQHMTRLSAFLYREWGNDEADDNDLTSKEQGNWEHACLSAEHREYQQTGKKKMHGTSRKCLVACHLFISIR